MKYKYKCKACGHEQNSPKILYEIPHCPECGSKYVTVSKKKLVRLNKLRLNFTGIAGKAEQTELATAIEAGNALPSIASSAEEKVLALWDNVSPSSTDDAHQLIITTHPEATFYLDPNELALLVAEKKTSCAVQAKQEHDDRWCGVGLYVNSTGMWTERPASETFQKKEGEDKMTKAETDLLAYAMGVSALNKKSEPKEEEGEQFIISPKLQEQLQKFGEKIIDNTKTPEAAILYDGEWLEFRMKITPEDLEKLDEI